MFVNDLFKITENSNEEYYAVYNQRGKPMIMRKPVGKTARAYAEEKNLTIKGGPFDSYQETESFWIRSVLPSKDKNVDEDRFDNEKETVRLPPEMTGRDPSKPYADIGPYTISMRGDDARTQQDARHLGRLLASVPNPLAKAAGMAMRYAGQYDKLPTGEKVARAIDSAGAPSVERMIPKLMKEQDIDEAGLAEAIPYALSAANAAAEYRRQGQAGGGYRGRIDIPVQSREDYLAVGQALTKAARAAGERIDFGLSDGVMSVFSDSMTADELDEFIDDVLDQGLTEDWKKVNRRDRTPGMSRKAVKAYRRENPGSKLQTAVTTKPSKLKKGSKSAKRRKSFCARMKGMKRAHAGAKTKRNPDSPINKALRRWNCESVEEMRDLIMIAEQRISAMREGGFDIPEIPRAPQPRPQPKEKTSEDTSKYMDTKPSSVTAKQADELGAMARKAFRPDLNPDYYKDDEPVRPRRNWDYSDPDVQPIVKQWMDKNLIDRKPMTYQQDVNEGFDDLDRFMKDKYGPKPRGGSGIKRGTYGQPGRKRGRPTGPSGGEGSGIPQSVDFDRPHSERSAGRRIPRFSDDYDSVKRSEVDEGSVQDKLHRRHQDLRKKRGAPDPEYYKELKTTFDLPDDQRWEKTAELKKKYKITNEDYERYIDELRRAGYEMVTEAATLCPECGGVAYEDKMLAEKQDACYHKVKSRYKVWPSAYASGALVRCRKVGAANWGNKSKK